MDETLRCRPSLDIAFQRMLEVAMRHGQVAAAARELRCSEVHIWKRFKLTGLTLALVLKLKS
jgi:hypothetical protein